MGPRLRALFIRVRYINYGLSISLCDIAQRYTREVLIKSIEIRN